MAERGSVLPAVLLVMFAGVLILGLALDLGRWAATWREAAFAADAGATAGAATLDEAAAYAGILHVDRAAAVPAGAAAAARARPRAGRMVRAVASTTRVCVTVRQPFQPSVLRAVGVGDRVVTVRACASPAQG